MRLHINKINEKNTLQTIKEKHFAVLEKAAATKREDSIKQSAKNKKFWAIIISIMAVLLIASCGIVYATCKAIGAGAGIFLTSLLLVFILASSALFLLEKPIRSNKAINESYENDLKTIRALKAENTTLDLLSSAQTAKRQAGLHSYLDDLLFDLIYDLETLQIYCALLNNTILDYRYDNGLYVTYADSDGVVHQDVKVRCSAQYNTNTKEDTLSFIEDKSSCRILLTRPYPVTIEE